MCAVLGVAFTVKVTASSQFICALIAAASAGKSMRVPKFGQPTEQCVTMPMITPFDCSADPEFPPLTSALYSYQVVVRLVIAPGGLSCNVWLRVQVRSTPYPVSVAGA